MALLEGSRYFPASHREALRDLGAEFELRPTEHVVVTGFEGATPLGNAEQTFNEMLKGNSAIKSFPVGNFRTNIAGPINFDISRFYPTDKDKRKVSQVAAMAEILAMDAVINAGIFDPEGQLSEGVDRNRIGVWIGSGIGPVQELINVYKAIYSRPDAEGKPDLVAGSRKVDILTGLRIFPQDVAGRPAMRLGARGWSGSTVEACATGASNIADAYRLVREGVVDIVAAGGVEDALHQHPETAIGAFAPMRIISSRNDEPERASRPFDRDRDGFVLSSGGGIVVLESIESAQRRGAHIYAEILGALKSTDGDINNPTGIDSGNVARLIRDCLLDGKTKQIHWPDAIFAHATSTEYGDEFEAEALRQVFREYLSGIPITALKSMLGHLLGGAGAVNVITAIQSMNSGIIPHIANLDNPDDIFMDLPLVRGKPMEKELNDVLAVAYGFNGFNAAINIGRFSS